MIKVSIIIPVYNTEKYLKKCLESVCNQTLKDIEIICINDCSTDNSLEILKEYSAKDNRIKIIDFKENKGAAVARNTGIDEAQGEYLGFVDSDDFVDLDFYEKLYNKAIETEADVVKGSYYYFNEKVFAKSINEKIIEDKNNFVCDYCSAIFRKNFLDTNNIKFPELCDMEDPVFAFTCAINANKVEICDKTYINIFRHSDSQTAKPMTSKRLEDKIIGLEKIIDIANQNNLSIINGLHQNLL